VVYRRQTTSEQYTDGVLAAPKINIEWSFRVTHAHATPDVQSRVAVAGIQGPLHHFQSQVLGYSPHSM
jgi:hypothetical protein